MYALIGFSMDAKLHSLLSLPLWERGGERGPRALTLWLPPSLTLPRKGGGNVLPMSLWERP